MPRVSKNDARRSRHVRLRKKLSGSESCPRLMVRRTLHHVYATLVDDAKGHTLFAVSTLDKGIAAGLKSKTDTSAARAVGEAIAAKAKAAGISDVVFDRGGFKYHGRVRALADAAREAGLNF
jgi:large subunit ribosomal protein L18